MTRDFVALALGRAERPAPVDEPLARLLGERALVTGADGSLGVLLVETLRAADVVVVATDRATLDVRWPETTWGTLGQAAPTVVLHLAGEKHAPDGELDPQAVCMVNAVGTLNIVNAAKWFGARVVTVSTCKACDPETAYGFSKALAERITLTAGGSVARLYNVVETSGNVFELWADVPQDRPLPVAAECRRYFISAAEAVSLILCAAVLPAGRYGFDPGPDRNMLAVAADCYPGRPLALIPPRRGDRIDEPRIAASERLLDATPYGIQQIVSAHDAIATREAVAA